MDHTYDLFKDIKPNLNSEELNKEDELLALKLSTIDYLIENDYDNAIEVLLDIENINESLNNTSKE